MKPDTTILVTFHGSHLYGLNKPDSDLDIFRVVASRSRPRVWVKGGFDYQEFGLDDFMTNVFNGSHQSCEALFSPRKYVHPRYKALFNGIRVTGEAAFARYRRTIHSFSYGDDKKRRHAVRLGFNLADLRRHGRFDPVLTHDQRTKVMVLSQLYAGQSLYDIAINL
jgi:hypothetical protein